MQRVSIGRAIVRDPRIFLMDEPLSNLDFKLRESLRVELKHLQKTRHSTTLFVTHDQIEALTMADRIAVLDHGTIIQLGSPKDIYDRPATTFVAQLVGTPRINLLPATHANGQIEAANQAIHIPIIRTSTTLPERFTLGIRPEDIQLRNDGPFHGSVALIEPLGVETVVHINLGTQTLVSTVPGIANLPIGGEIQFDIARERLHVFDGNGVRV
jgi:multiple sugar transport system ATP-binding protein